MKPIALVVIAKNEDLYLHEWVEYHLKLGFDHICIYQNNWRSPLTHPQVTKFEMDCSRKQQLVAYKNFTLHQWKNYSWAMFMDVDEFLVLKKHKTVTEFAKSVAHFPSVGVPWYLFGDSGQPPPYSDYSVLKRFIHRGSLPWSGFVKSLVKMDEGISMHAHKPRNRKTYTPEGIQFRTGLSPAPDTGIAQVNHYYCKTFSEHQAKVYRGDVMFKGTKPIAYFDSHNQNDVLDTQARDFLYGDCSGVHSKE